MYADSTVATCLIAFAPPRPDPPILSQTERCGKPVFDVILELDSNDRNAWTIIDDVAQAVDDVLAGKEYKVRGGQIGT
jgi:hypothetical protein